jgi:hypothetical protein
VSSPSISPILREHTCLSITSFDRLYLNGYLPGLQTPGQLVAFCREQLGARIPSPALFEPLRTGFRAAVARYAEQHRVPLVGFRRGQRKDDVAAGHRARFHEDEGVVFIGTAQEQMSSFKAAKRRSASGGVWCAFSRQPVAVTHSHSYFYVHDAEWGPAFLKVGTYLPYPVRVCLNGHEWAKQQLRREGVAFTGLDNGFRWCADPARLQQVCDALGPADVQAFFDRWVDRLPWPLTPAQRAAGYTQRLSLWQVEVSLTQVFAEPSWGRRFFEGVIRENLDLGRPDRVSLAFPPPTFTRATPAPRSGYRSRVITRGVAPSLHVAFKSSHVKQYFKEGWALRTETTCNDPTDVQPTKALASLPHLRQVGQQINARLLDTERLAAAAVPEPSLTERVQQPRTARPRAAGAGAAPERPARAGAAPGALPDGVSARRLPPSRSAPRGRRIAGARPRPLLRRSHDLRLASAAAARPDRAATPQLPLHPHRRRAPPRVRHQPHRGPAASAAMAGPVGAQPSGAGTPPCRPGAVGRGAPRYLRARPHRSILPPTRCLNLTHP